MRELIYYFDLGNTRGKFWRCCDGHIEASWAEPHQGDVVALLRRMPDSFDEVPDRVLGLSVLGDEADRAFCRAVAVRWRGEAEFASASADFQGLRSAYKESPERLGVDRWLGLIGAAGNGDVVCVVGCGTALTIDVLSGLVHRGGYIVPGLALMEWALLQGTRQVRFDLANAGSIGLGNSTASSVRNGALVAAVALIEKLVREERVDRLVLTGGDARTIAAQLAVSCVVEQELLLAGMMRYFKGQMNP